MEDDDLETEAQSIDRAVDLLDRLLCTADGDRGFVVGEYAASTIIALLTDKKYRISVMSRLDDFEHFNLNE